ncbi:MAG: hypothetical protein NZ455_07025 [Bacteroidia bacterium]|nr:hypothetical protein [Bacteroidia bacterium]
MLRCATHCLTACSVSLTQQPLDVLPHLYKYVCFTLFNIDYQILTILKFFTLFQLRSFYLILCSLSSMYKIKP